MVRRFGFRFAGLARLLAHLRPLAVFLLDFLPLFQQAFVAPNLDALNRNLGEVVQDGCFVRLPVLRISISIEGKLAVIGW